MFGEDKSGNIEKYSSENLLLWLGMVLFSYNPSAWDTREKRLASAPYISRVQG